ncbi:hypothetical protein CF386_09865 [Paraphotobacterium marinum]|uniref:DUF2938 domain-containing protein n=1 Tax=Paraphotobacterium marinum TaxID=1755811 RepID=A0A220VGA8_9GAMM|nr:DUF2938 family protein [Paraphotobacterium marinum]ASK79359.1 hypothetical protein CF386_09865 [Paraphotobacterium marinum]
MLKFENIAFNNIRSILILSIFIGIIATIIFDLYSIILNFTFNIHDPINMNLLGRWIGYLIKGDMIFHNIPQLIPIKYELALGWISHYLTGILVSLFFLIALKFSKKSHSNLAIFSISILFGWFLMIVPFTVMMPVMGGGYFASSTPNPEFIRWLVFFSHSIFGLGLFVGYKICKRLQ